jgi:hypothetical protein
MGVNPLGDVIQMEGLVWYPKTVAGDDESGEEGHIFSEFAL